MPWLSAGCRVDIVASDTPSCVGTTFLNENESPLSYDGDYIDKENSMKDFETLTKAINYGAPEEGEEGERLPGLEHVVVIGGEYPNGSDIHAQRRIWVSAMYRNDHARVIANKVYLMLTMLDATDLFPISEDREVERNRSWRRDFVARQRQLLYDEIYPTEPVPVMEAKNEAGDDMVGERDDIDAIDDDAEGYEIDWGRRG